MSKSTLILSIGAAMAALAFAPAAYAAGEVAVDYIVNSYLVMLIQSEGFRLGCF
jgi:hypothetical protein